MNAIKESYPLGECPDCGQDIPDNVEAGQACTNCEHVFGEPAPNDDPMDGDHQSGLASAGFGTDEDYGGGDERI